jgi:DNA helicase IV
LIDVNVAAPRELKDSYKVLQIKKEDFFDKCADETVSLIDEFVTEDGLGRVVVLIKADKIEQFKKALEKSFKKAKKDQLWEKLNEQVGPDIQLEIVDPRQTKGLEFDATVLAEPADFLSEENDEILHKINLSNLYVALSRSMNRLTIVHSEPLPRGIDL